MAEKKDSMTKMREAQEAARDLHRRMMAVVERRRARRSAAFAKRAVSRHA